MTYELEINQGLTRQEEEFLCKNILFRLLNRYIFNVELQIMVPQHLIVEHTFSKTHRPNTTPIANKVRAIMPGSFNPFHIGHGRMLGIAQDILDVEPYVEITMLNADKGAIDYFDIQERIEKIPYTTLISECKTFVEKARQFENISGITVFIIGTDTWNRLLDEKYGYTQDELFREFVKTKTRFLVFNRPGSERLKGQSNMESLCIEDDRLNIDIAISSSEIRAQQE
jgi:nicotinic acid mononucleotide adenylyltransferase